VAAQTVPPGRENTALNSPTESPLDPVLTDFCSRLDITPAIREFHDDEEDSDLDPVVSNQSSDIEDESELKTFTQALQRAQVIASKEVNKNKRGSYSKWSRNTLKCHEQVHINLASKGFLPVDEYMRLKANSISEKHIKLTPKSYNIVNAIQEESEESSESSDNADAPAQDTCEHSSINNISKVESEGNLPKRDFRLHLAHRAHIESEESSGDNKSDGVGHCTRRSMSKEKEEGETRTTGKHLEDLRHEAVLAHQQIT